MGASLGMGACLRYAYLTGGVFLGLGLMALPAAAHETPQTEEPAASDPSAGGAGGQEIGVDPIEEEVRDPRGPVTAEDLATGNIEVPGEPVHDNEFRIFARTDRLEYQSNEGKPKYLWDIQAYAGGDYNKIWFESEGEGLFEEKVDSAELLLLYSRAVAAYWDIQMGARYDVKPDPSRAYAVVGLEGLAPLWFEVEADIYLSDEGDFSGTFEVEYDELLTQRLILQPRAEVNFQMQDVPELGLGAGVTDYELGLRLRYEIAREFAPYIGVSWQQTVGETANLLPEEKEESTLSFVAGVRAWF